MIARLASLAVVLGALGCHEARPSGCAWPDAWDLDERQFVLTSLTVPRNHPEIVNLAFDLDGNGTLDNRLGGFALALDEVGPWNPQADMDQQMARGENIVLLTVYASEVKSSTHANAWTFIGLPQSLTDGPQAGGTFEVDLTNGPSNAWLGGHIHDGAGDFGGYDATAWVRLASFGDSLIELKMAHIAFELSADGERLEKGRLAGAIAESEMQAKVLPGIQATFDAEVRANCGFASGGCTCTPGSYAETIQAFFDTDGSCDVSLVELQNNDFLKPLAEPDVTLPDGSKGLSVALGFTAVRAIFYHPTPPTTSGTE